MWLLYNGYRIWNCWVLKCVHQYIEKQIKKSKNKIKIMNQIPLTHMGGAPVAFATRKDIAISSQFLVNQLNCWANNKTKAESKLRLKSDKIER